MTQKIFTTPDGHRLAYHDESEGPPLLCLAGLTRNSADFDYFTKALNAPARILRLDMRGRGGSDADPNVHNYNIYKEAEDALALLDHLDIEIATILGASRGGINAMILASLAPGRVKAIILSDVGPEAEGKGFNRLLDDLGTQPPFKTLDEAAMAFEAKLSRAFEGHDTAYFRDIAARSYIETSDGLTLNYDPAIKQATLDQMMTVQEHGHGLWPIWEDLKSLPVLLLKAANSNMVTAETLARMKAAKPDLELAIIPKTGHIPRLDEPEALVAIRAFLKEHANA